jgi:uncharacterized protein
VDAAENSLTSTVADLGPWVETSEHRLYLYQPTFPVTAVAHSLAQINRYNGHAKFPYSVATHAVNVSLLMEELHLGDPFEGLHHDDTEYVIGDIASPFKRTALPDYMRLEAYLDGFVRKEYDLPEVQSEGVHVADLLARFIEAEQLLHSKGRDWKDPEGIRPRASKLREQGWRIPEVDWKTSRRIYLERHYALLARRAITEKTS